MNTTFLTWLAVAAVIGGVLLLLLGAPVDEASAPLTLEEAGTESSNVGTAQYWEPVATTRIASAVSSASTATYVATVPVCSSCHTVSVAPVSCPPTVARSTCTPTCATPPSTPCLATPCTQLSAVCASPCVTTCTLERPGINPNLDPCVAECTFVQLHSTLAHPICGNVCFEWAASKGAFLDPNSPDPIYFVPSTQFASGEDVWIVLTIWDQTGTKYTDQLKLHVVNVR